VSKIVKILTHSGMAHLDEIYGIAALCLAKDIAVSTVEITRSFNQSEANDTTFDYVVDFGLVYNGVTRFDHHQDDESVAGLSSFGLVVKTFDKLKALRGTRFVDRVDYQDLNGPAKTFEKFLGISTSPSEFFGAFEGVEQMLVSEWLSENYRFVLDVAIKTVSRKLEEAKAVAEAKVNILKAELVEINGLTILKQDFNLVSSPAFTAVGNNIAGEYAVEHGAVLILGKGRDPKQFSLLRTTLGEDVNLNLSILKDVDGVGFAHPSGFFAAVQRDADLDSVISMLV